jgi:transposase/heme-degrading monooxygenase HmoA
MESYILIRQEFSMVIRVCLARLQQGKRHNYVQLCRTTTIPHMEAHEGYLRHHTCESHPKRPNQVVVATLWQDRASVQNFIQLRVGGVDWDTALALPWETNIVVQTIISYVDDDYQSLTNLWSDVAPYVRQRDTASAPFRITDEQWQVIAPILDPSLIGPARRGRPRLDNRFIFDAVFTVIHGGLFWSLIPSGASTPTSFRRYREWVASGAWEEAWQALLSTFDAQTHQTIVLNFLDRSHPPRRRKAP